MIYTKDSKVYETIFTDPSVIQILNRFGIRLGVGDMTFAEIGAIHHIDVELLLDVINTYLNADYYPTSRPSGFCIEEVESYLNKTATYYRKVLLPNIDKHFGLLMARRDATHDSGNLGMLRGFYNEVKGEIEASSDFTAAEEKINDLLSFFTIHLRGDYDNNLCVAVVTAIFNLKKDMTQNNRIRERILKPLTEHRPNQASDV